jgi:nitrite reductase/ring-hydroxylating ferredoxin subunit
VRHVVDRLDRFAPGTRRIVRVGGREIGVFRVGDRFFALRNRCPHQGGPLARGRVFRRMVAALPGEVTLEGSTLICCPWHGWHWDMLTGEAYAPDDPRVRSYDVSVESGRTLACSRGRGSQDGEPFVAETFTVSVEEEYVVLEA